MKSSAAYRSVPFSPRGRRSAESLAELRDHGIATDPYYARTDGLNPPYYRPIPGAEHVLRARREVCHRLARVNRRLQSHGVELLVLDAYRSLECQQGLWKFFIEQARRRLQGSSRDVVERYALKFCSDPRRFDRSDSRTWPTHMTGGAVDLTLKRIRGLGEPLFMGSVFDDPSEISQTDHFERPGRSRSSASDNEARTNRRLLYWAMDAEGFSNLSTEWWHYDWGTQLWAFRHSRETGRQVSAFYDPV